MFTPFSQNNKSFTDKCHLLAQRLVYPRLFGVSFEQLNFVDSSLGTTDKNTILDGQMAVDRLIEVKISGFNAPLEFTIQERFRKPNYAHYKDITITEWNTITNLKSELYKLNAGIFLYGYANSYPDPTGFVEVIAVDTTRLLINMIRGDINSGLKVNPRTEQTFITITFGQLISSDCVIATFTKKDFVTTTTDLPLFQEVE